MSKDDTEYLELKVLASRQEYTNEPIETTCLMCGVTYDTRYSKSSLRMTYCTSMCEVADLGFHLRSLELGLYVTSPFEPTPLNVLKYESLIPRIKPQKDTSV